MALIEYVVIHIQSSEVKKPRNTPAKVKSILSGKMKRENSLTSRFRLIITA